MSIPDIHFIAASTLSLEFVADLYTRTFADYFYNAFITASHMEMFVRVEQLDLARSPVLRVGDEPVGLATVGLRGERAYCKGFGIVAPFRGRGLAAPLCAEVIRQARLAGARTVQLGVMQQNERAVKTYLHAGLHVARELVTFAWDKGLEPIAEPEMPLTQFVAAHDALDSYAALHPVTPTWGRDLTSLREMAGLCGVTLAAEFGLKPYLLYEVGEESTVTIMDIAAERKEQAVALLAQLQRKYSMIVCNNEPDTSPMLEVFRAAGFRETIRRFEMVMEL